MAPYKVLLCAMNSRYVHASPAPWCLRAGVERTCEASEVQCTIEEGTVNEPLAAVLARVEAQSPDLLGLSCYIWNITAMLSLASVYKLRHPETKIVLGGPEVSYRQEEILRQHPAVDYILSGEGEETLPRLIRALLGELPLAAVPSLSYREADGRIVVGEPFVGTVDPPSPYAGTDVSPLRGRIAYLEGSRGCPYRCTFCLSGRLSHVRYFSMDRVKGDVLHLAKNGVRVIKFVDRTFNADRAYAHCLWEWIADEYGVGIPAGTRFHFEIAGERLGEESFAVFARMPTGAIQLEIGLQSFHPATLRAIRRNPDTRCLEENIRRLSTMSNVHTHVDLIAGLPEEDYSTFVRGFDRAYRLGAHMLQLGFLKLLPGAPMTSDGEDRYECRYSHLPPYEVIETPSITAEELDKLRLAEDALDRLSNSGRFRRTLHYLTGECGLSPYGLFYGFSAYAAVRGVGKALDPYTEAFAAYASSLPGVDRDVLLDRMICDRLATNSSGVIPDGIRNFDKRLKRIRLALETIPGRSEVSGVRRTLAVMRSEATVVYADYEAPDPVTGEYSIYTLPLATILGEGEVT